MAKYTIEGDFTHEELMAALEGLPVKTIEAEETSKEFIIGEIQRIIKISGELDINDLDPDTIPKVENYRVEKFRENDATCVEYDEIHDMQIDEYNLKYHKMDSFVLRQIYEVLDEYERNSQ